MPAYYPSIASHNLDLPVKTLRSWFLGREYNTSKGKRQFERLIEPACAHPLMLSFTNLVEAHMLSVIRFARDIRISEIRPALKYLEDVSGPHPLANVEFLTGKKHLFATVMGEVVDASSQGQAVFSDMVTFFLARVERDVDSLASSFFPVLRRHAEDGRVDLDAPRVVVIDPRVCFGKPAVANRGIPTEAIVERYRAGEGAVVIAKDIGCDPSEVEEAIRWEERTAKAA